MISEIREAAVSWDVGLPLWRVFFSMGMKDGSGHSDDSEASDHSAMYDDPVGEGTYE